jgi:hypothetical protein
MDIGIGAFMFQIQATPGLPGERNEMYRNNTHHVNEGIDRSAKGDSMYTNSPSAISSDWRALAYCTALVKLFPF